MSAVADQPDHEQSDENDWQGFVAGRAHGITGVLLALAQTHPNPAALLAELEKVEQSGLAQTEAGRLGESYVAGMRDVIDRVRNLLRLRLAPASDRHTGSS